jgi:hypothetical protein
MNAQWGQLLGLKEMYLRKPDAKWYWIGGCDNYVHHDYVLKRLQASIGSQCSSSSAVIDPDLYKY